MYNYLIFECLFIYSFEINNIDNFNSNFRQQN